MQIRSACAVCFSVFLFSTFVSAQQEPFDLALSRDWADLLAALGESPELSESTDYLRNTVLHHAVAQYVEADEDERYNLYDVIEDLVEEHGIDPTAKNAEGATPLALAHMYGLDEIVDLLQRNTDQLQFVALVSPPPLTHEQITSPQALRCRLATPQSLLDRF